MTDSTVDHSEHEHVQSSHNLARKLDAKREERPGKEKPPGISDVARLANVSIATVSRTLSDPKRVAKTTRERVINAIQATNYVPNRAAQAMRGVRSKMVLVVVPSLITTFFSEFLLHVDRALSQHKLGFLVGNLDDRAEKAGELADLAYAGQISGAILINGQVLRGRSGNLGDGDIPCVAVSHPFETEITSVQLDEKGAIALAADHLISNGHRSFAYVAGDAHNPIDLARWRGLKSRLRAAGLPKPARLQGDFRIQSGMETAADYLAMKVRPTAVVCASDEMAIGFLSAIKQAGLNVPQDVSITGFDGITMVEHVNPPLTTIVQPQQTMAECAVIELIRLIEGDRKITHHLFSGQLRLGQSTAFAH